MPVLALVLSLIATGVWASPEFWRSERPNTDFENNSVENWMEIMSGGPPKDGIPALDNPSFIPATAETELSAREPSSYWIYRGKLRVLI
jgi:hypothetical protein